MSAHQAGLDERLGGEFARALFAKDFDGVRELLDPDVDFRGLTPSRTWEAASADELVEGVLKVWFEDSDELMELRSLESGRVSDRGRVSYCFQGQNPDGPFVVEQQVYYATEGGRINWMRTVCSGFRPPGD